MVGKKSFTLLLSIMLSCIFIMHGQLTYAEEANDEFETIIPQEVQDAMAAQEAALDAYFGLVELFDKDIFGAPIYPEEYGGEYIDDNNCLVVQVTEAFKDQEILHYLRMNSIISVKFVQYSYQTLMQYRKLADELYKEDIGVISDGVNVKSNTYRIVINKQDINKALHICNDYFSADDGNCPVEIEEGQPAFAMASLWGGRQISK